MADYTVTAGQKVNDALAMASPGDVIFLAGTFVEDVKVTKPGITMLQKPGAPKSKLQGRFWVTHGSDNFTAKDWTLNGRNTSDLPSPCFNANNFILTGMEITNENTVIGTNVGAAGPQFGSSDSSLILNCHIHHNGVQNNHEHGIYADTCSKLKVEECLIHHNGDRGIQAWPNCVDGIFKNNLIAYNGMGIMLGGGKSVASQVVPSASKRNVFTKNIIGFQQVSGRGLVEEWYGDGAVAPAWADRNVIDDNVIFGPNAIQPDGGGFIVSNSITKDPLFTDGPNGNFKLEDGSPAIGYGPASIQPGAVTPSNKDQILALLQTELDELKLTTVSGKSYFNHPTAGHWKNAMVSRQAAIELIRNL